MEASDGRDEIDEFMERLAASRRAAPTAAPFDLDAALADLSRHAAFVTELKTGVDEADYSESVQALQALKYDDDGDSAEQRVGQFKDDGNEHFRRRDYRRAVDSYTLGLKTQCADVQLQAALHANRAAAHFRLGNWRSSWRDCVLARRSSPTHGKAAVRGAESLLRLGNGAAACQWIDLCLRDVDTDCAERLRELRLAALKLDKETARDGRRRQAQGLILFPAAREAAETARLFNALNTRLICCEPPLPADVTDFEIESLNINLPLSQSYRVRLDADSVLVWPVLLRYPEFAQTDFIREFSEDSTFREQLAAVFESPAEWDVHAKYTVDSVAVCGRDSANEPVPLTVDLTLAEALSARRVCVRSGLPTFDVSLAAS